MNKKTKKILLVSGILLGVAAIVSISVGVVISIKNKQPKKVQLNENFVNIINSFIQENKITTLEWFDNSSNLSVFYNYLSKIFEGIKFIVSKDGNNILKFEITNNYVFDNSLNIPNIVFNMENNKILNVNVVLYNPTVYIINSNQIFEFVQNYIFENKIIDFKSLVTNEFKEEILNQIFDMNSDVEPKLTISEFDINVSKDNLIKINILPYVNAIFELSESNSNNHISISNKNTNKEITISDLELYKTKIDISSMLVTNLQNILFNNNIIFPSYIDEYNSSINISNNDIILEIINLFNMNISDTDSKLVKNNIKSINYSLLDKNANYGSFSTSVAKISLKIELTSDANFEFNNLENNSNITISNNGKNIEFNNLYAYNGLIVNDAMINSSSKINEFLKSNNISYSNANEMINNIDGGYFPYFWYTFLTGQTSGDLPEGYYDPNNGFIKPELYDMTFTPNSIKITLKDNCGFRFYTNNLSNGDILVSNDFKSITINNIVWPKKSIIIDTTNATSENLTSIFQQYNITNSSMIDEYKSQILTSLFNNKLPINYCNLQYDPDKNMLSFNIVNNSSSNITYYFNTIGTLSYSIGNIVFPSSIISPVSNYKNLVQLTIFNFGISTEEKFNSYLNSIISNIFQNKLSSDQYSTIIQENNVILTINENVNIEIQSVVDDPDSISKTFEFPFTLCSQVNINENYQDIITYEFLQSNSITLENINDISSISTILNAIILNDNKEEIISIIAPWIVILYKSSGLSEITLSDNKVDLSTPYIFNIADSNTKTIKINLDFNGPTNEETPTPPSSDEETSNISKFFVNFKL